MTDNSRIKFFRAPTPFGTVYVHPLRDGEIHIRTDGGTYPFERTAYEGDGAHLALRINGVEHKLSAHMKRRNDGTWRADGNPVLTRRNGRPDPSESAWSKIKEIFPALARWLDSDAAAPVRERMAQAQQIEDETRRAALYKELAELDARRAKILELLESDR